MTNKFDSGTERGLYITMYRRSKRRIIRNPAVVLTIIIVIAIGIFLYFQWDTIVDKTARNILTEQEPAISETEEIPAYEPESVPPPPTGDLSYAEKILEENSNPLNFDTKSCEELQQRIDLFFTHLDEQEYIQAYNLESGSKKHFQNILQKVFANPPIVVRETDSLFTILTNTAHFYRILGKTNVNLIKEILNRESDNLEITAALFAEWSERNAECSTENTAIRLPLQGLYEYAGFFLNTLGGQAYLFRRDSRIRMLIKYYCILTLDRANVQILNRHGIDIRSPIKSMINEMQASDTMVYREEYLRTLLELREKYQAQSPDTEETPIREEVL